MKTLWTFRSEQIGNDHSNHENTLMYNKTMHVASFFKVDGQLDRTFIFLNIFCFINGIFNSKTWRDQPHIATCKWNKNHVYAFQCHFETLFHLNIVLCGNFLKLQQNKTKTQCSVYSHHRENVLDDAIADISVPCVFFCCFRLRFLRISLCRMMRYTIKFRIPPMFEKVVTRWNKSCGTLSGVT